MCSLLYILLYMLLLNSDQAAKRQMSHTLLNWVERDLIALSVDQYNGSIDIEVTHRGHHVYRYL